MDTNVPLETCVYIIYLIESNNKQMLKTSIKRLTVEKIKKYSTAQDNPQLASRLLISDPFGDYL